MIKTKSQHYNFGHEALPILFHTQTKDFLEVIQKDGIKFLRFWWDHVGERLDNSLLVPFEGMKFELREIPEKKAKIVLIRMPHPTDFDEFHWMALVKKPDIRMPFVYVKMPTTRVFALSHVPLSKSETGTLIYEITLAPGTFWLVPAQHQPKKPFITRYTKLSGKNKRRLR